jgi:hypothetical protein
MALEVGRISWNMITENGKGNSKDAWLIVNGFGLQIEANVLDYKLKLLLCITN